MCPLAVAGLGLRYLRISVLDMLGRHFRKPVCVALRSVDIFGLYNDWCANFTLLARVKMECAKFVVCCTVLDCTALGRSVSVVDCCVECIDSIHKSVVASLYPRRMCLPLYITSQCLLQNITVHPASNNTRIPISEAIDRLGKICPVSIVGNPGIVMLQQ